MLTNIPHFGAVRTAISRGVIESVTVALPPAGMDTRAKSTRDNEGVSTVGETLAHFRYPWTTSSAATAPTFFTTTEMFTVSHPVVVMAVVASEPLPYLPQAIDVS